MLWTEIAIEVFSGDVEIASAVASVVAPDGLYIEDYADMDVTLPQVGWVDVIDGRLLSRSKEKAVIHLYLSDDSVLAQSISFIDTQLTEAGIPHGIQKQTIQEIDWQEHWKCYYKPMRIGEYLVICPSWETYAAEPQDVVLTLDPGSAFGTGTHETTQLCLELLEKHLRRGDKILDVGCGSGILSIAGLKLGASGAVAVDIDPYAALTALKNAEANGFSGERYRTLWGNVLEDAALCRRIGNEYAFVTANIVADVVLPMKSFFFETLSPGGRLAVSGIIQNRAEEVVAALREEGFHVLEQREKNGWVAAAFQKGFA